MLQEEAAEHLFTMMEEWRLVLAKNVAKNNPGLSVYNLNTVVQKIIDRIVFFAYCRRQGALRMKTSC
jgi:hypothetical protein